MKKLWVMAAISMLMAACSDDGSSEGAGAGPTGSDAPFTGDGYEIVVDEVNHSIDMIIRENLGTCQLSADSTSASWISGPENFTLRYIYEISNDTLFIFRENDYPTKRYGQVFVGNSSTLYGTWSECSHASIRGGEVDDDFDGYTPIDSTVWTFSPGRLTISSFVAGDWDLYKNEFMLNLLNGHYYLRGDQIFHSANNDMAKYAEGVEEVSRNGLDAVFKVGEKQVSFTNVKFDFSGFFSYEESFSFDMSYDGKLCSYRYYSTDDMKDVCSVGNIPYFRVGDELDAYRYTDENVSEFWECARDLFNL